MKWDIVESTDIEFDYVPGVIPFLADWVVNSRIEFPLSASIEMVLASVASSEWFPILTDIDFYHSLTQGEGCQVHLQISQTQKRFQILRRRLDRPDDYGLIHISGSLDWTHKKLDHQPIPFDVVHRNLGSEIHRRNIYRRLDKIGLMCGPSFRIIDSLKFDPDFSSARVELPELHKAEVDLYLVHPILASSIIQVISLMANETEIINGYSLDYIHPARIGSIQLFQSGHRSALLKIVKSNTDLDSLYPLQYDAYLLDHNFQPIIIINKLALGTANRRTPRFDANSINVEEVIRIVNEIRLIENIKEDTNLFSVGLTSLDLLRITNAFQDHFDVRMEIEGFYNHPTVGYIVDFYKNAVVPSSTDLDFSIMKVSYDNRGDLYPISKSQEQFWFLEQVDNVNQAYNEAIAYRIKGDLIVSALTKAVNHLCERHEALRTTFKPREGKVFQIVMPFSYIQLDVVDLKETDPSQRENFAMKLAGDEAKRPFDLSKGPLVRFKVIRLNKQEHIFLIVIHHIIADEWSLSKIAHCELSHFYSCFLSDRTPNLPPPPLQLKDFARWERAYLESQKAKEDLTWWKERLLKVPKYLDIAYDFPLPMFQNYHGNRSGFFIPSSTTRRLRDMAKRYETTPYLILLSVYAVFVWKKSRQSVFCIGTPTTSRISKDLELLFGCLINVLPILFDLHDDDSFIGLLRKTRLCWQESLAHQNMPLSLIVNEQRLSQSMGTNPLVQVLFVFRSLRNSVFDLKQLQIDPVAIDCDSTKVNISLNMWEYADSIEGFFEYDTDLFRKSTIGLWSKHFIHLLEECCRYPEAIISDLSVLDDKERCRVLQEWNCTETVIDDLLPVYRLFEIQSLQTPDVVALTFSDRKLTYNELDSRSNLVAEYLQSIGVEPEVVVAIFVSDPFNVIIGILSILKAGGAYLPLDPEYPVDRIKFMLENSNTDILLTQRSMANDLPIQPTRVIHIEDILDRPHKKTNFKAIRSAGLDNLAYIIYTSGSTGIPKGIAMHHKPLSNLIKWQCRNSHVGVGSRTLQFSSICFDVSFQEIFSTLSSGGSLVLIQRQIKQDAERLLNCILSFSIERIFLPFVALNNLATVAVRNSIIPFCLKEVITAGEQLQINHNIVTLFSLLNRTCLLVNQYGPTETHVVTSYKLKGHPADWHPMPPIGRPIVNTKIYLLNSKHKPVGVGEIGEIYIGGDCVSRGYYNSTAQTNKRFIPNFMENNSGTTLYRTGDLGRYLTDGNIEFLGRVDNQIKIRGYRVELGEIENVLSFHNAVRQVVVLSQDHGSNDRRIIAYIVLSQPFELVIPDIKKFLLRKLPEYMVPFAFVCVDRIPLTASGKIDRKALSEQITPYKLSNRKKIFPSSSLEKELYNIWIEVLKLKELSIDDNFFDLGGNSLLLTHLSYLIKKRTGTTVSIRSLIRNSTIERLARHIQATRKPEYARARYDPFLAASRSLVLLRSGEEAYPPIFFIHSVTGTVSEYRWLADELASPHPLWGVQDVKLNNSNGLLSLEETAAEYLEKMATISHGFPFYLIGHSMGGAIAYEMARILQYNDKKVMLLALLDTVSGKDLPPPLTEAELLAIMLGDKNEMTFDEFHQLDPIDQKRYTANILFRNQNGNLEHAVKECERSLKISKANEKALRNYLPRPLPIRLVYFKAKETLQGSPLNPESAWAQLVGGNIECISVEGNHFNMLNPPYVKQIAYQLEKLIYNSK